MRKQKLTVKYDGKDLLDIVDIITDVNRGVGPGWENNLANNVSGGADFYSNRKKSRKLTISYVLTGTTSEIYNKTLELEKFINKTKPCPLIFTDAPNIVWQAIIDGDQDFGQAQNLGKGTLVFIVPSGYAESLNTQIENNLVKNQDGSYTIALENNGNLPAFPKFKIKFDSDNGYLGIVGQNGILEIGNKEETDGENYLYNESFLNSSGTDLYQNFKQASITSTPANNGVTLNGSLLAMFDGLRLGNYGSGPNFHGGILKYDLPLDRNGYKGAKDWYSYFNIWFWAGAMGQTGIIQLWYMDKNDKVICMNEVVKDDKNGNTAHSKCWVANGSGGIKLIMDSAFQSNNAESNQALPNYMYWSGGGDQDILKNGPDIRFYWYGYHWFHVPEIENMELDHIYVDLGALGTNPYLNNISLRKLTLEKQNEILYRDVPNKFSDGSELLIDMFNDKLMKNNIAENSLKIKGSNFFSIPPGSNEIQFVPSTWFEGSLEIEATWNERY